MKNAALLLQIARLEPYIGRSGEHAELVRQLILAGFDVDHGDDRISFIVHDDFETGEYITIGRVIGEPKGTIQAV